MKPYVFFTFVSDNYYTPVGTPGLINSFKKFHPDIPLVIFRQDILNQIMDERKKFMGGAINWLNAKPVFAKLLTDKYECVVNIDADSVILGRLDEVFSKDYDVGSVINMNEYEPRFAPPHDEPISEVVNDDNYLQAGMVASRRPEFWDIWLARSLKDNWQYKCAENDTLNLVVYEQLIPAGWKLKVFDKDKDYYGCKLLGLENKCEFIQGKIMCNGQQVKAYHAAKGPQNLPKLSPEKLEEYGFKHDVVGFIRMCQEYGTSVIYDEI